MTLTSLVEDRAQPENPSGRAMAVLTALGLAALVLASAWIPVLLPPSEQAGSEVKLSAFLERKDEFDTLILGSSLALRDIDPVAFDARMAELGFPTRSFNFGLPAMDAFEQEHVLREVLAARPARLRTVFVAPEVFSITLSGELLRNRRVVLWHELSTTLHACSAVLEEGGPLARRVRDVYRHLRAWFYRAANVGEVRSRFDAWIRPGERVDHATELVGADGRGFVALDGLLPRLSAERRQPFAENRAVFLERLAEYRLRVTAAPDETGEPGPLRSFERAWVERVRGAIEGAGAIPVFYVLPESGVQDRRWMTRAHAEGLIPWHIDLSSPREHPEFYAEAFRFDRFHLNAAGAELLSQALAERFAEVLRSGGE